MNKAKITFKGQVTIPKEIREALTRTNFFSDIVTPVWASGFGIDIVPTKYHH